MPTGEQNNSIIFILPHDIPQATKRQDNTQSREKAKCTLQYLEVKPTQTNQTIKKGQQGVVQNELLGQTALTKKKYPSKFGVFIPFICIFAHINFQNKLYGHKKQRNDCSPEAYDKACKPLE